MIRGIMKQQTFSKEDLLSMDPMHDVKVKDIKIDGNTLVIRYENLREAIFTQDGTPYYDFGTLTIKYCFESFCSAIALGKRRYISLDLSEFLNKNKRYTYLSYKISVDNWNELTLEMNINKMKHGKYLRTKWHSIYISLDPIKVIYEWSD